MVLSMKKTSIIRIVSFQACYFGHTHNIACKYDDSECSYAVEQAIENVWNDIDSFLKRQSGQVLKENKSIFWPSGSRSYWFKNCLLQNWYSQEMHQRMRHLIHVAGSEEDVPASIETIDNYLKAHEQQWPYKS